MLTAAPSLLRFLACGSVDDGKSSLIGRLLYDCGQIFNDQLAALERDNRRQGTVDNSMDFALLLDGLAAEREQGITIDVARRYFSTPKRSFIVADTPGHEQYTRNMATGASECDVAVILADARKGLVTQTRRHSAIVHLLGIRHVVLAVNKMDLVGYREAAFHEIKTAFEVFAQDLGIEHVTCIPVVARSGDNIVSRSPAMSWYIGPTLLNYLEEVELDAPTQKAPLRFPVQLVLRPNPDFRGLSGTIMSGQVSVGDQVVVMPSGRIASIGRIAGFDGDRTLARTGEAATIVLDQYIDVGRGDVIAGLADRPNVADQASADIIWMGDEPLLPGRPYWIQLACQQASAAITTIKHKINMDTLEGLPASKLEMNEIARCNISFSQPLVLEPYARSKSLGGFILIDKITNATVGAGMICFALRRATNIHWQTLSVDRNARAAIKHQRPLCLWFTGLSGSGKSTIANLLEKRLHASGRHTYLLDGDNVRHGLNRDLGFTAEDRVENIRRVAEVAKLMVDAGLIVIVSFISPFTSERRMARELFQDGNFVEVFVDTPISECERRDPKGLYSKARAGQLKNFTGIDSPYEPPEQPEIRLDTLSFSAEELAEGIDHWLAKQT